MPVLATFGGTSLRNFGLGAGSGSSAATILGDFESIATVTIGSGGALSADFTSIPQTYSHLQIRMIGRTANAYTDDNIHIRFNSDTGNNYAFHYFYGTGAAVASGNQATYNLAIPFRVPGANSSANMFGSGVCDILDYTNTNKYKTLRSIAGHDQNGSGLLFMFSGLYFSTAAITSISLFYSSSINIAQNTTFALYGISA
jgi:hypothetical protein